MNEVDRARLEKIRHALRAATDVGAPTAAEDDRVFLLRLLDETLSDPDVIVRCTNCTWWDSVDKAALSCPHCGGALIEWTEAEWWQAVNRYAAVTVDPNWRSFIEWRRGRCFPTVEAARAEFDAQIRGRQ